MDPIDIVSIIVSFSFSLSCAAFITLAMMAKQNKALAQEVSDWRKLALSGDSQISELRDEVQYFKTQLAYRKREIAIYESDFARLNKFVWGEPLMPHTVKELEDYIAELHQQVTTLATCAEKREPSIVAWAKSQH